MPPQTRNPQKEYVTLEGCSLIRETEKAFLIQADDEDGESKRAWVPKSQIWDTKPEDAKAGDSDVAIKLSKWIAQKAEFIS